ncbi:MAG: winged helix-turn-helix domain-containing protein [Methanobacteriota archaeon]
MDDAPIELSRQDLKALASDTRLSALKHLEQRNYTVSELSRLMDLNKATLHEHLETLLASGLVRRLDDPERQWVYYELSWKGRRLLHPERSRIMILLSTAAGSAAAGVLALAAFLMSRPSGLPPGSAEDRMEADQAPSAAAPVLKGGEDAAAAAGDSTLLAAGLALVVIALILCLATLYVAKKSRPTAGP